MVPYIPIYLDLYRSIHRYRYIYIYTNTHTHTLHKKTRYVKNKIITIEMCTLPWRPPLSLISSTFTNAQIIQLWHSIIYIYNIYIYLYMDSFHTIIKMFYFCCSDKSVAKHVFALHCKPLERAFRSVSNGGPLFAWPCQLWRLPINSRHCGFI